MHNAQRCTAVAMGTFVTIDVCAAPPSAGETLDRVERAFGWFHHVEECCNRFDAGSELMRLTAQIGVSVPVSAVLYEAVRFAVSVAEETDGAFDPTIGSQMERNGFNREYRTGRIVRTDLEPGGSVSYRDVQLDSDRQAITLLRPLILDLGAVAKGLAIDLAANELRGCGSFAINAGGDLSLGGCRPDGASWSVGIRHPSRAGELIDAFCVSDRAVCTSGDYERVCVGDGHHILDPRSGTEAHEVASATVVAPTAMLADAVATAAFVLGPVDGIRLFDRLGVDGLLLSPTLERFATRGMYCDYHLGTEAILSDAKRCADHRPRDVDADGVAQRGRVAGRAGPS